MRGGSRFGAGRPGWRGKVESLLHIDVRQWASRGLLVPDQFFGWHWSRDGEEIASIGIQVNSPDSLTLKYTHTPDGEASRQSISEAIPLVYTPCHYGGRRIWFSCPHCRRRVAKLYLLRGHWYCRKSLTVAYSSQSLDVIQRMHRCIGKLESKLGENGEKPKGMHWSTYNRILEQCDEAQSRLDYAWTLSAARLLDWEIPLR